MNSLTSQNTPARSSLEDTKHLNRTNKLGVDSITQLLNKSIFNNRKRSIDSFVSKPNTLKTQSQLTKQSPQRQHPLLNRKMSQPILQSSLPKSLSKENFSKKPGNDAHLFLNISSVVNQEKLKYSESMKSSEDERLLMSQDLNSVPSTSNLTSSMSIIPRSSILSTQPIRKSDDLVETGGINSSSKNPVTLQSTQVLNRRRMSQTRFEQEMFQIQMHQKEREQTLIKKFSQLKEVAQQTIKMNQRAMLSQTQPFEAYEQRMQKFEMMIDLLLDRNGIDQSVRDGIQRTQSQGLLLGGTQNFAIGRDAFYMSNGQLGGSMVIPEGKSSFRDERRSSGCGSPMLPPSMHNINVATTVPGVQTLCINLQDDNFCSSSASTHDQRLAFNQHQSLFSHRSGAQSSDNEKPILSVKRQARQQRQEEDDSDTPQLVMSSQMNPGRLHQSFSKNKVYHYPNKQPQNQEGLQGFIETLQTIEDYRNHPQTPEGLDNLKEKLLCYRDQLKSLDTVENQKTQQQIVNAIDVIIQKMQLQSLNGENYGYQKIVELERQGTNIVDSSILIDKTNTHMNLTRTPRQQVESYDDGRQETQPLDYGGDVTENSIILSSRKSHQKHCNKSGYQVKHSRYLSAIDHYQVIHHPLQTNEEHDKSWLQEIKHLKALLGSMALNHSNDKMMQSYIADSDKQREGLLKDQSKNSQCSIF